MPVCSKSLLLRSEITYGALLPSTCKYGQLRRQPTCDHKDKEGPQSWWHPPSVPERLLATERYIDAGLNLGGEADLHLW